MAFLNESHIEEADIAFFTSSLKYEYLDGWQKKLLGRESLQDVVLKDRLYNVLEKLNPDLPPMCLEHAVLELSRSRAGMSPLMANKQVYELIRGGVPVTYGDEEMREVSDYVRIIDFQYPEKNDFLVVSQLSIEYQDITGITRRPDVLLYVNGLPLVMVELKNATEKVKSGYDDNLQSYKENIPQLFCYNLFVAISNGIQTRVGSYNAPWEHFFSWVKLEDSSVNAEQPGLPAIESTSRKNGNRLSLQLFCEGLCNKINLLDYFENFVLYHLNKVKIIAKNHQFLGANNAVKALEEREGNQGKLGIFWHTQGSGKSYSMIFFTRKVNRKIAGDWSFLIVTDRNDLDDQIFRNFLETETLSLQKGEKIDKNPFRAKGNRSRKQLQDALQANKSYYFSTIFNFGIKKGLTYCQISARDNWVVIVDEAHRSQYKALGENMRIALPNAQYIAFTGTPLLSSELTRDWFGAYVSEYNFAQSIEDGATVPLFYKKSVPRVEQVNENLLGDAAQILENENLSEEQQEKLDREYSTLLQVVRRDDRLEEIAKHIVQHFPYRLDVDDDEGKRKPMKAMVISIDKFTAVKMYEKTQYHLKEEIKELRRLVAKESDAEQKKRYLRAIAFMEETKMAVVISLEGSEKQEKKKFARQGIDIAPHRKLMEYPDEDGRNIEDYFKDPNNLYRIVFVTAMWLTGFDAPTVSTLYLDKPMQNHTLMQTIARANRVFEGKKNGIVIDYFGVFRNLKKALSAYAEGSKGKQKDGEGLDEFPVKEFAVLLKLLEEAIVEAKAFCRELGADIDTILGIGEKGFKEIELFEDYANTLLERKEYKNQLGLYVNTISSLYDSAKPEIYENPEIKKARDVFEYLRKIVDRSGDQDEQVERAKEQLDALLDSSVLGKGDLLKTTEKSPNYRKYTLSNGSLIDLGRLNFEQLRQEFKEKKHKNIEFEDLSQYLQIKLRQMTKENKTRGSLFARFEKIIEEYNSGSISIEEAYEDLTEQAENLSEEERRAARNGMTEEELEIFDLLKKDTLTKKEKKQVKLAAQSLLKKLKNAKDTVLIEKWYKELQSQARVRREIQVVLSNTLPESYDQDLFDEKINIIFQHLYNQAERGVGAQA
ncbi:type I restriction endonuclease subunit R [Desulfocastanea catecholica]